jgi:hypothetical protein
MNRDQTDNFFQFKKMLSGSRVSVPWPGLEDDIMHEIEQMESVEEQIRRAYQKGLTWSWIFFIVGIGCGLILTHIIPQLNIGFEGINGDVLLFLFQAGFAFFVIFQLEKLIKLGSKSRSHTA